MSMPVEDDIKQEVWDPLCRCYRAHVAADTRVDIGVNLRQVTLLAVKPAIFDAIINDMRVMARREYEQQP